MEITTIQIEKFKRLSNVEIDLKDITVLVGGNNSGKSSFLQGAHFGITTLQSAEMAGGSGAPATTLGIDQLIYKPADSPLLLNHNTQMSQTSGPKFTFTYTDATPDTKKFELSLKRGKNANIAVACDKNSSFYGPATDRTRPLSIFVPGLAGVALKEERRSEAILNVGIAQGDSNLYLRNVLLRITQDQNKLDRFHETIRSVFPDLGISTNFDEARHQYIPMMVSINGYDLPLEMIGTGCLQAIQLVAYATMYDPKLLLLDEPDSHLHPSNQRLLASTLVAITEKFGTKIVLSTHSRHMFDALRQFEQCQMIWLKNGQKQDPQSTDLSMLLDLGALDSYELVANGKAKVVVLTEDTRSSRLEFILEANGFKKGEYFVQPFHGVDSINSALPVADYFTRVAADTHVLIHRDGDALLVDEKAWLNQRFDGRIPERAKLFITPLTDVEHQFCQSRHLVECYGMSERDADTILDGVLRANASKLLIEFTNKRREAKDKILRAKEDAPSAEVIAGSGLPRELAKGKTIFGQLLPALTTAGFNAAKLATVKTEALKIPELQDFARKAWPEE